MTTIAAPSGAPLTTRCGGECGRSPHNNIVHADCDYVTPGFPLRLNLGGGKTRKQGFRTIDAQYETEESVYPLHYGDETADEIYASHVLEHFSHHDTEKVLREWIRVLKPGGCIRIAVPDFEKIAEAYLEGEDINAQGYIMGGHVDRYDHHGAIFDREGLTEAMREIGLVDIREWTCDPNEPDCSALPISLNLQGTKPLSRKEPTTEEIDRHAARIRAMYSFSAFLQHAPFNGIVPDHLPDMEEPEAAPAEVIRFAEKDVHAYMTLPRLAFTDTMHCCLSAFTQVGCGVSLVRGVFWNQAMAQLLQDALADGRKYAIIVDYDSVFTAEDVRQLLRLMEQNPHIDALCPVQMKRESAGPLFTIPVGPKRTPVDAEHIKVDREFFRGDTSEIATGHFGLTIIRVEKMRDLPKPWFHAVPSPNGEWSDGRMDADIAFWHEWRKYGRTLHLANHVTIGHLQLMVTWPGENFGIVHQFTSDYHKKGAPANVWK